MTARLHVKPGVILDGLAPGGCRILVVVAAAVEALGHDQTITNGIEGHPINDPHTRGDALDVKALELTDDEILAQHKYFVGQLGPAFTVLYECPPDDAPIDEPLKSIAYLSDGASAPHFHIQVKKGTTYPGVNV